MTSCLEDRSCLETHLTYTALEFFKNIISHQLAL